MKIQIVFHAMLPEERSLQARYLALPKERRAEYLRRLLMHGFRADEARRARQPHAPDPQKTAPPTQTTATPTGDVQQSSAPSEPSPASRSSNAAPAKLASLKALID